ncbi:MAG TPA: hypothetical protein VJ349_24030, partial [Stellaceae bacterium]|nr:hypothetical protein [Stellaceae bacterium]
MSDALSAAVSIGFHGLAFAMVLYLISVGLSVTMLAESYVATGGYMRSDPSLAVSDTIVVMIP